MPGCIPIILHAEDTPIFIVLAIVIFSIHAEDLWHQGHGMQSGVCEVQKLMSFNLLVSCNCIIAASNYYFLPEWKVSTTLLVKFLLASIYSLYCICKSQMHNFQTFQLRLPILLQTDQVLHKNEINHLACDQPYMTISSHVWYVTWV